MCYCGKLRRSGSRGELAEEDALLALLPLVRGTLSSIEQAGIVHAMPGPVSRGDVGSVVKHLSALAALDPEILDLYRALCARTIVLAIERGSIERPTAARIRRVLAEARSSDFPSAHGVPGDRGTVV